MEIIKRRDSACVAARRLRRKGGACHSGTGGTIWKLETAPGRRRDLRAFQICQTAVEAIRRKTGTKRKEPRALKVSSRDS